MIEEWRDIPNFKGYYEISNLGRVRSFDRIISYVRRGKTVCRVEPARIMVGGFMGPPDKLRYHGVSLSREGRTVSVKVHTMVLTVFIEPRPPGKDGCHNDGDVANNRLNNLRWDTPIGNNLDKLAHGTEQTGSRNGRAKLTEEQVRQIKRRLLAKETLSSLAREHKVSVTVIWQIKHEIKWKHVD